MNKSFFLFLGLIIIFLGCTSDRIVRNGDNVSITYAVYDSDILLDNNSGRPLNFVVGAGEVIRGVDMGVLGMKKGENKILTISPENGYGLYYNDLVVNQPLTGNNTTVNVGDTLYATNGNQKKAGIVTEVTDKYFIIDFNHPLAGKILTFNLTLSSINKKEGVMFK